MDMILVPLHLFHQQLVIKLNKIQMIHHMHQIIIFIHSHHYSHHIVSVDIMKVFFHFINFITFNNSAISYNTKTGNYFHGNQRYECTNTNSCPSSTYSPSLSFSSSSAASAPKWKCPQCTFEQSPTNNKCAICGERNQSGVKYSP